MSPPFVGVSYADADCQGTEYANIAGSVAQFRVPKSENRVQESEGKWPQLKAETPDIVLHLIGMTAKAVGAANRVPDQK